VKHACENDSVLDPERFGTPFQLWAIRASTDNRQFEADATVAAPGGNFW
jgi:hypothetical protein